MYTENVRMKTTELARTITDEGIDNIVLQMVDFYGSSLKTTCYFMVSRYVMDCERLHWNKFYNSFEEANEVFQKYVEKYDETEYNTEYEKIKEWNEDDDEPYASSSSSGDYSPANPWNAPGMSVSDFIKGVW